MSLGKITSALKEGKPLRIVAIGDSLTFGWMVDKGYVHFLDDMIAGTYPGSCVDFINRGIPGDTAEGGLRRVYSDVVDERPQLVIIQFGLNDACSGYTPAEYRSNIDSMIKIIKSYTAADIILLSSSAVLYEDERDAVERLYDQLEASGDVNGCTVVRAHEYWYDAIKQGEQHEALVQADGVHPTERGYRLMAEAVMQSL